MEDDFFYGNSMEYKSMTLFCRIAEACLRRYDAAAIETGHAYNPTILLWYYIFMILRPGGE